MTFRRSYENERTTTTTIIIIIIIINDNNNNNNNLSKKTVGFQHFVLGPLIDAWPKREYSALICI